MGELHVVESTVMGRLAVANTAGWLAVAGTLQIIGFPASRAIAETGGHAFDVTWALCFIVAFLLAGAARALGRRPDPRYAPAAAVVEIGAIGLMTLGLGTYVLVVLTMSQTPYPIPSDWPDWTDVLKGRIVLLALACAAITNAASRAILLIRQARWVARRRA